MRAQRQTSVPVVRARTCKDIAYRIGLVRQGMAGTNGRTPHDAPLIIIKYRSLQVGVFPSKQAVSLPKRLCRHRTTGEMRPWTSQEIRRLRVAYPRTCMKVLECMFRRSAHSIYKKAQALGAAKAVIHRKGRRERVWTRRADRRLLSLHRRYDPATVAQLMRRTTQSVRGRLRRLGVVN